ncbi:H-NS family nucleoid-associated regulatory protein [Burkholderia pseudomallei]|uniref:H-NS family nucleoid-associated regulatory protein n=1 Tax=Burkholderia pseudomallei TaxID=28450 RepID=UPI000A3F6E66
MSDYQRLVSERKALLKRLEVAKQEQRALALANIRKLIAEFELMPNEVFGRKYKPRDPAARAARYRDPETGATWSGFGRPPMWIAGKEREAFAISQ